MLTQEILGRLRFGTQTSFVRPGLTQKTSWPYAKRMPMFRQKIICCEPSSTRRTVGSMVAADHTASARTGSTQSYKKHKFGKPEFPSGGNP